MGIFDGPATNGQVISITSTEPLTGKYVVIQLMGTSELLALNEVKVTCAGKVLGQIEAKRGCSLIEFKCSFFSVVTLQQAAIYS